MLALAEPAKKEKITGKKKFKPVSLFVTVGVIGSGKSTWAQKFSAMYGPVIVSPDVIRNMTGLYLYNEDVEPFIIGTSLQIVSASLHNKDVIYDETNHTVKMRRRIIKLFRAKYTLIAVDFRPDAHNLERRLANHRGIPAGQWIDCYERMLDEYVTPTLDEGFDYIITPETMFKPDKKYFC